MAPRKLDYNKILENRNAFSQAIAEKVSAVEAKVQAQAGDRSNAASTKSLRTFVRIRPILPFDVNAKEEFQVAHAIQGRRCLLAEPRFSVRGDTKPTFHHCAVDGAFGPEDDTATVYASVGAPLVNTARTGGTGTIMAYGQTGSGKTHTMTGLMERFAQDIFVAPEDETKAMRVTVSIVEIHGDHVRDLITGTDAEIAEDFFGKVQLHRASCTTVQGPEDLLHVIQNAFNARSTKSTQRNDVSSRTHAVIRLRLEHTHPDHSFKAPGELNIVDLAGSERNYDQFYHDKAMMEESRLINNSLMTLKDCIRKRAELGTKPGHIHIPYRQSRLTLLLKDSFELNPASLSGNHLVFTIACFSPLAHDANHTLNTLRYARDLHSCKQPDPALVRQMLASSVEENDPMTWSRSKIATWLKSQSGNKIDPLQDSRCTLMRDVSMAGRHVASLTRDEFHEGTASHVGEKRAQQIYERLAELCFKAREFRRTAAVESRTDKSKELPAWSERRRPAPPSRVYIVE